jgi:parvulin-like peptidyl-prolyl isomerase
LPKNNISAKPQREPTKKQLSHWQRESRLQHFIMIGGIIVVLAIMILAGIGIFMNRVAPMRAVILKIGNTEYTMEYFINTLTYMDVSQADISIAQFYTSYAKQQIEQNHLLIQEAAKLDPPITVSDKEVTTNINENKLSNDQTRIDAVRAQLIINKLKSDYFGKQIPATAEHRSVWAMFLSGNEQADEVRARLEKGEKFNDLSARFSLEETSREKKGEFGWMPPGVLSSVLGNAENMLLEDKVFSGDIQKGVPTYLEDKTQSQGIGYWLIKVLDTRANPDSTTAVNESGASPTSDNTQVHLYGMLLETEQLAKEVKTKLTDGGPGNDFSTLAKTNSILPGAASNGGDLGWKLKGNMGVAIDNILFPEDSSQALAKDKVSNPIQNTIKGGFWLFQVNGIENQTIADDNRTILVNSALDKWFKKVWADNENMIQDLLTEDQMTYAFKEAQKR